jgi:hypothetical protein
MGISNKGSIFLTRGVLVLTITHPIKRASRVPHRLAEKATINEFRMAKTSLDFWKSLI